MFSAPVSESWSWGWEKSGSFFPSSCFAIMPGVVAVASGNCRLPADAAGSVSGAFW